MKKQSLVTGANRGIGLEFTKQLLNKGWLVVATTRNLSDAKDLENLKRDYPNDLQIEVLDTGSNASVEAFSQKLAPTSLDLLINNAGVIGDIQTLDQLPADDILNTLNINSVGPARVVQKMLSRLKKSATPVIAHVTSMMGSIEDNTSGGYYSYRMSKAALNMFNKSFSIDFPSIKSIVLHPGWVKTRMGGAGAKITTEESVTGMLKVVEGLKSSDTGRFFDYSGKELPW